MKVIKINKFIPTLLNTESEMKSYTVMKSEVIAKAHDRGINPVVTSRYLKNKTLDKTNTANKFRGADLSMSLLSVLLVVFLFLSIQTNAQSRHYWSQNFNTESSLVAGAVIGGDAGPSAVYYNPALIKEDDVNKIALSANLLSFQNISLDKIASSGTKQSKFLLKVQPKFLSYTWGSKKDSTLTYELAFLVPLTYKVNFTYLYNDQLEVINRLDGIEEYTGEIGYKFKYDDFYAGGGVSKKISERFTIGASGFLSVKVMDYGLIISRKAQQNSDTVYSNGVPEPFYFAENTSSELMNYFDTSLLFKLGFHYRSASENWGIGLNITSPNLSLFGSGNVTKAFNRSNIFDNSTGQFASNLSFISSQEKVKTKIKDPLSIAFGLQYKTPNKKTKFMFSTEYFTAIDSYKILKTSDSKVVGNLQMENVAETMTFYESADSVLNAGAGVTQYINEKLTINGGFRTDFNTTKTAPLPELVEPDGKPKMSVLHYDKFHIMAGPRLQLKKIGLVLGVQYTTGKAKDQYNISTFNNPIEYDPVTNIALQGQVARDMEINYTEVSIFFGLTYGIGK